MSLVMAGGMGFRINIVSMPKLLTLVNEIINLFELISLSGPN